MCSGGSIGVNERQSQGRCDFSGKPAQESSPNRPNAKVWGSKCTFALPERCILDIARLERLARSQRRDRHFWEDTTRQMPAKKPNILILWGDDIGIWNISKFQQRDDGLPDAQHRPRGQRRRPLHRLLFAAELHRRPRLLHHRARTRSAPASPRSACPAPPSACRPKIRRSPSC